MLVAYIALALAALAVLTVPFLPVGSREKVGARWVLTSEGWMRQH
jgi:hypothetical protein